MPCLFIANAQTPTPTIHWQKSIGGSEYETATAIIKTTDNGYAAIGISYSGNGDMVGNHGLSDAYMVKLREDGSIAWKRMYGGSLEDGMYDVRQTPDGGYIMAGYTKSSNGDVTNFRGMIDVWIIKTDANGNIQWQKTYGGSDHEVASSIRLTQDGGYLIAAYTMSVDGDITSHHSINNQDFWLVKINSTGVIQWQKCYGGSDHDNVKAMAIAADGGIIIAGDTRSMDGDVNGNHGQYDIWVIKTDADGALKWQQCIGGSKLELAQDIIATADGGCIITGNTQSNDGNINGNHGKSDGLVLKLSAAGAIQWSRCYGGSELEDLRKIVEHNGSYIVVGSVESNDGDVTQHYGWSDYWMIAIDANGTIQWQKVYGGTNIDDAMGLCNTTDGVIITGTSFSADRDINTSYGGGDNWIVNVKIINPLPAFTTQPADQTVCIPKAVQLKVVAINTNAYQWQQLINNVWTDLANNNSYTGVTTATLSITSIGAVGNYTYRCIATNAFGSATSAQAVITGNDIPTVTLQPQGMNICAGKQVQLSVAAANAAMYQWQTGQGNAWNNLNGNNQPQLSFIAALNKPSANYRCVITNTCGAVVSNIATVTVEDCFVPNAFSPNGDNIHDTWDIPFLRNYPRCSVSVYNRNGQRIFECRNGYKPWNGLCNNKPVAVGVYYYTIELKDGAAPLSGNLTVLQ